MKCSYKQSYFAWDNENRKRKGQAKFSLILEHCTLSIVTPRNTRFFNKNTIISMFLVYFF